MRKLMLEMVELFLLLLVVASVFTCGERSAHADADTDRKRAEVERVLIERCEAKYAQLGQAAGEKSSGAFVGLALRCRELVQKEVDDQMLRERHQRERANFAPRVVGSTELSLMTTHQLRARVVELERELERVRALCSPVVGGR